MPHDDGPEESVIINCLDWDYGREKRSLSGIGMNNPSDYSVDAGLTPPLPPRSTLHPTPSTTTAPNLPPRGSIQHTTAPELPPKKDEKVRREFSRVLG